MMRGLRLFIAAGRSCLPVGYICRSAMRTVRGGGRGRPWRLYNIHGVSTRLLLPPVLCKSLSHRFSVPYFSYTHICIHRHTSTRVHTRIHALAHTLIYTHTDMHAHSYIQYIHMDTHVYIHAHTYIHIYVCTCMHTYSSQNL